VEKLFTKKSSAAPSCHFNVVESNPNQPTKSSTHHHDAIFEVLIAVLLEIKVF
jgi:hypothetical protein